MFEHLPRIGLPGSGDGSDWAPILAIIGIFIVLGIVAEAKGRLRYKPWWHTIIVVVATLGSALFLTARYFDGALVMVLFALVPCAGVIGTLYLLATKRE